MRRDKFYQKALDLLPDNAIINRICYFLVMIDYILWAFRGMNMEDREQWQFSLFFSTEYDHKWGDFMISYRRPEFEDPHGMFNPPDYPVANIFAWTIFAFHVVVFAAITVIIYE